MNPFKLTDIEYQDNFGEKKNFLKSLIFLIFKGTEEPSKIEDKIINQTIVEYYDAYFHPFTAFTEEQRQELRERLLLEDKKNGKYEEFQERLEEKYSNDFDISEAIKKEVSDKEKVRRQVDKLHNLVNDSAASDGEKDNANKQLQRLMPELVENRYLSRIEKAEDACRKSFI